MKLIVVAGVASDGAIGRDGGLLWRLPGDLAHFKRCTLGHPVIMGRKTWDSLPPKVRPLPERRNIVVTRNPQWRAAGAEPAASLPAAIALARGAEQVAVIGGAQLYALALPIADELMLTEGEITYADADTHFPVWDRGLFDEVSRETHRAPDGWPYHFVRYRRRL